MAILLAASHVSGPAHHAPYDLAAVPADMGNGGVAPFESLMRIAADERDVFRYNASHAGEFLKGGMEKACAVQDECGWRCVPKKRFQAFPEGLGGIRPIRQVVGAGPYAVRGEFAIFIRDGGVGRFFLRLPE